MNINPKKTVFLIDGSSFLYRAYYAIRPLHTKDGTPVNAVYGFCTMIKKLIDSFNAEYIAVCWDSKGKTVRHELFADYKATRQAPPADLFDQKQLICEFLDLVQIPQIAQPGVEADDLLFSAAKTIVKEDYTAVVVSSDKDLAQFVEEHIILFDPFKNKLFGVEQVEEKYGFAIEKLPFYFSLLGDTSDNIPGVKGIGPKGAVQLVQQFKSLQDMYENLDQISKPRTKKLLEEHKDNAFLSLQLFTIHHYEVKLSAQQTAFCQKNWDNAAPFFAKLNFSSLLKTISLQPEQQDLFSQPTEKNLHELYTFTCITTQEELIQLAKQLESVPYFALDTETTGLDPMRNHGVGLSISYQEGLAFYIPFAHNTDETQCSLDDIQTYLGPIFKNKDIIKILHNTTYDRIILKNLGIPLDGPVFDTLIAASLLMKDWQKKGLKWLSEHFFDEIMLSYDDMVKKHKITDFSYVPIQDATKYAAADAHQTLKLYHVFEPKLQEEGLLELFNTIEMPITSILARMQQEGIYCDAAILQYLDTFVSKDLKIIEDHIADLIGETINLNSPKQVKELLFDKLNLPPQKKSAKKTGYSTDAQVLKALSALHPVPGMLLKYRELYKLQSTYIHALPTYINPKTGKIHTTFNQTFVATGRLSSSNPNLQNIPTGNTDYEVDVRAAFKADKGHQFIAADYSQIELRILAYFSQDEELVAAFTQNQDIHTKTAQNLFDLDSLDAVTPYQRSIGKKINFSILYGLTPYGLSKDLDISVKDAKFYIESYFAQYPHIKTWMHDIIEYTKTHGYTKTHFGRRRYIPGIYEKNQVMYKLAERIAINTPVQGTAAEIMKLGMIRLQQAFNQQNLQAKLILQIHDEIIVQASDHEITLVEKTMKEVLESVVDWDIAMLVQTKTGYTWHEVTK